MLAARPAGMSESRFSLSSVMGSGVKFSRSVSVPFDLARVAAAISTNELTRLRGRYHWRESGGATC